CSKNGAPPPRLYDFIRRSMTQMNFQTMFSILCMAVLFAAPPSALSTDEQEIDSATAALSLTVYDSILMALKNNRSLAVQQYDPDIARTFIVEEQSQFDSSLDAAFSFSDSTGQRTSGVGEFRPVKNRSFSGDVGLSKQFPVGLDLDVGLNTVERESNVYTRMFSSRLGASLMLPVLEGFGKDVNLAGVRLAEKDVDLSLYELRGFVLALIAQVEENYWDLLTARKELNIHNTSLELANKQLTETKDRIEVGELAEIDLAAAEGEVALREKSVIDARSAIQKSTLRFLQALNPSSMEFWMMPVDLLDEPIADELENRSLAEVITTAMTARPDLNQARIDIEKQDIQLVQTRNGLLPKLDFFITLGKTGYASTFGDSFSNIGKDDYDISAGFTFSMPLGNRLAKTRHRRITVNKERAETALQNFQQLVELDVRIAFAELSRAKQQISATKRATQLQQAKYQAELEKFRVGKSTNLLVLTTQRDLIASQLDEVNAQINLRKAILGLHVAEGALLDHYKIVLPTKE
ncbi:MAG: TolC family protein, partial [Candidatus Omnitrophica bacterium]|nr:TolC family protein [Candidatus Omnitrophota bacterium]